MAIIGNNTGGINPLALPKSLPAGVPQEIQQAPADCFSFSGSGFATPVVAGTAALILSQHPDMSPAEMKSLLIETSDNGMLNASKAMERASAIPASVDGANIAGVKPQASTKGKFKESHGLEGIGSLSLGGIYSKEPLGGLGFGFKSFD